MKRLIYIFFAWLALAGCKDDETELGQRISYDIADMELVIPSSGKTMDYTILTTNTEWTITGENEWCKVSPNSGGAGTTRIYFELTDNEDYSDRDVRLTLNVGTETTPIAVIQKKKDALTVTKGKWEFDQTGGSLDVKVTANVECFVKIPTPWITQEMVPASKALEERLLKFTVASNPYGEKRQGEIIIEDELRRFSDTIRVYQTQKNQIILTANEYSVPLEGLDIDVQMKSNIDFDWSIVYEGSEKGWIHDVPQAKALSSSAVRFAIDETAGERRAKITFRGKNMAKPSTGTNMVEESITVIQRKMNIIIVTSEQNKEVPQQGGTVTFEIQKNVDYEVKIPQRVSWITELPPTKALDKNVLSLRIAPNPADQIEREARIVIKAKNVGDGEIPVDTVYVHQLGRARLSEYQVLIKVANAFKESKNFSANFGAWGDPNNPEDGKITADWKFVTLNEAGKVIALEFKMNGLKGTLPKEIGDLEYLETFTLPYYSDGLTGDIPAEFGKLKNLKQVVISSEFTSMPDELGNLENLKSLSLRCAAENEPKFIGELTNLTELKLLCHYNGPVPAEIGNLKKLTSLTIGQTTTSATADSYNRFTALPEEIGNLENLTSLRLYGGFEGAAIPSAIGKLINLTTFQIQQTGFVSLPEEIGNLKNIKVAYLHDNKFKAIPAGMGRMESLTSIQMQNNKLEGNIPDEIADLPNLNTLQLSNNKLSGSLEVLTKIPTLTTVYLDENQFEGDIDFDWSRLVKLSTLKMNKNKLEGDIPVSLLNLVSLSTLDLSDNQFATLPDKVSWTSNEKLTRFYLQNNRLSGTLPEWLCSMKLSEFNIENNDMNGGIPAKLFGEGSNNFTLSSSKLNLNGNRLNGTIPEAILIELLGGKRAGKWLIVDQQEGFGFDNWKYSK